MDKNFNFNFINLSKDKCNGNRDTTNMLLIKKVKTTLSKIIKSLSLNGSEINKIILCEIEKNIVSLINMDIGADEINVNVLFYKDFSLGIKNELHF
jgi:hypothetical protein